MRETMGRHVKANRRVRNDAEKSKVEGMPRGAGTQRIGPNTAPR